MKNIDQQLHPFLSLKPPPSAHHSKISENFSHIKTKLLTFQFLLNNIFFPVSMYYCIKESKAKIE